MADEATAAAAAETTTAAAPVGNEGAAAADKTAAGQEPVSGLTGADGADKATAAADKAADETGAGTALKNGLTGSDDDSTKKEGDGDGKGAVEDKKDGEKTAPAAPENYEFKVPEGFTLDQELVGTATPLLKKYNVSQEDAQAFADLMHQEIKKSVDSFHGEGAKMVEGWKQTLVSDKEIGGKDLDRNLKTGLNALKRFGSPELTSILRDTGMEYHPEVVRFFVKVGRAIAEDSTGTGDAGGASAANTREQAARIIFDKSLAEE